MQTEIIKLGDREYILAELPLRKARDFRENLRSIFTELTALLESAPGVELNDGKAVAMLIRSVSSQVLDSIDTATDLLCEYSQDIQADREYVEDHAVGSQVVDAFMVMLTLVFPFLSKERTQRIGRAISSVGSNDKAT